MNRKATRSRNSGGLESYSRSAFQKQTLKKSIFGLELSKSASKRCMTPFALKVFHEMHGTYKVRPGTCQSYLRSFEAVPQYSHRDGRQSQAWVAHEETSHFRRKSITTILSSGWEAITGLGCSRGNLTLSAQVNPHSWPSCSFEIWGAWPSFCRIRDVECWFCVSFTHRSRLGNEADGLL